MIRINIRRVGVLAATTALAGVTFAGAATAADLSQPNQGIRHQATFQVTGAGADGGTTGVGGSLTQFCPQIPVSAANTNIGLIFGLAGSIQGDNVNCVVTTGDAAGGAGISATVQE